MFAYVEKCNVEEAPTKDIVYVIIYDNGEAYPEDHDEHIEAVFADYRKVKDFFEEKYLSKEYQMTKTKREIFAYCDDYRVKYLKVMQEEWHSDAEDDYYDGIGYYIVKTFNKNDGNELFDIVEVVECDE